MSAGPPEPRPGVVPRLLGVDGIYERKSGEPGTPHRCNPPGWWRRWRDGVKAGAIWQCSCGERYEFRPREVIRKGQHRPGQRFHPWWRIIETGGPPPPRPEARPSSTTPNPPT